MNSSLSGGLKLTEEEAFALLGLCLTSPMGLDSNAENALRKLAEYCTSESNHRNITLETHSCHAGRELREAGA
jgi:hypothetical protein